MEAGPVMPSSGTPLLITAAALTALAALLHLVVIHNFRDFIWRHIHNVRCFAFFIHGTDTAGFTRQMLPIP